ncbi:hypothetical protein RFI_32478, partial [Reticulomyxa filosa]
GLDAMKEQQWKIRWDGLLTTQYGNPELQYEHRFHDFQTLLQPPFLTWSNYVSARDKYLMEGVHNGSCDPLFTSINERLIECKKLFEHVIKSHEHVAQCHGHGHSHDHIKWNIRPWMLDYLKQCIRVSVTNSIFCLKLLQWTKKEGEKKRTNNTENTQTPICVTHDFRENSHFVCFRIESAPKQ